MPESNRPTQAMRGFSANSKQINDNIKDIIGKTEEAARDVLDSSLSLSDQAGRLDSATGSLEKSLGSFRTSEV